MSENDLLRLLEPRAALSTPAPRPDTTTTDLQDGIAGESRRAII